MNEALKPWIVAGLLFSLGVAFSHYGKQRIARVDEQRLQVEQEIKQLESTPIGQMRRKVWQYQYEVRTLEEVRARQEKAQAFLQGLLACQGLQAIDLTPNVNVNSSAGDLSSLDYAAFKKASGNVVFDGLEMHGQKLEGVLYW